MVNADDLPQSACCLGHLPLTDSMGKGHRGLLQDKDIRPLCKQTHSPCHRNYHIFDAAVSRSTVTDDAAACVLILFPLPRGLSL